MSLTAADVAEIMKILEGSGFDEVLLEIDGLKLSMRRGSGALDGAAPATLTSTTATALAVGASAPATALAVDGSAPAPAAPRGSATPAMPAPEVQRKVATSADPTVQDVTSPLLGTCYRAPKPGAAPFVAVGTVVSEETIVAIVEVMKLMNTVRAGVKGSVTEILMRDGALVEYGETLLRIKKAG